MLKFYFSFIFLFFSFIYILFYFFYYLKKIMLSYECFNLLIAYKDKMEYTLEFTK